MGFSPSDSVFIDTSSLAHLNSCTNSITGGSINHIIKHNNNSYNNNNNNNNNNSDYKNLPNNNNNNNNDNNDNDNDNESYYEPGKLLMNKVYDYKSSNNNNNRYSMTSFNSNSNRISVASTSNYNDNYDDVIRGDGDSIYCDSVEPNVTTMPTITLNRVKKNNSYDSQQSGDSGLYSDPNQAFVDSDDDVDEYVTINENLNFQSNCSKIHDNAAVVVDDVDEY
eukprot:Pgem_evm1s8650